MNIIKYIFIIVWALNFGSNCFGARILNFKEAGYKVEVNRDGSISFLNYNNPIKPAKYVLDFDSNLFKEIFKFKKSSSYFLIWPWGIYKFYDSKKSRSYEKIRELRANKWIRINQYFLFIINEKLFIAREGEEFVHNIPIDFIPKSLQLIIYDLKEGVLSNPWVDIYKNKSEIALSLFVREFEALCNN